MQVKKIALLIIILFSLIKTPVQGLSESLEDSFKEGDLIFKEFYFDVFDGPGIDHIAIYVGDYYGNGDKYVIESYAFPDPLNAVKLTRLEDYLYNNYGPVDLAIGRVHSGMGEEFDNDLRAYAIEFALERLGRPFDFFYFDKQIDGPWYSRGYRYYCSELVWAAYIVASEEMGLEGENIIDLDSGIGPAWGNAVSPGEIYNSHYVEIVVPNITDLLADIESEIDALEWAIVFGVYDEFDMEVPEEPISVIIDILLNFDIPKVRQAGLVLSILEAADSQIQMSAKANYEGNYLIAYAELNPAIKLLIKAKSKVEEYSLNYSLAGLKEPINPAVEPEPIYPPDPDDYDELINKAVAKEILREYDLANAGKLGEWDHIWNPWYEGYCWYESYIHIPHYNPEFYEDYGSIEDLNVTKYIDVTISRIGEIRTKFDKKSKIL